MKTTQILLFLSLAGVASATSVTFTLGQQTINGTNIAGLSSGASDAQIQNYMDAVLTAAGCSGCSVTVTGAVADQTYNGEGHVVGPGNGATSLTLGNSTGAANNSAALGASDTFIANTNDSSSQISTEITMKFSGFTINGSAGFNYEIFPNGTCPSLSNCGSGDSNLPDFTFEAGTNSNGTDPKVDSFGTNGVQYGVAPSSDLNGTSTHSPNSGSSATEASPQYIGTWSGTLSNVNELDFVDWPSTIGVDSLTVSWNTTSPVPETSSILLLGTILAGIFVQKRFRKTA
jgi:hypothetical protein